MALTESNMLELGLEAPMFNLPDTVSGNKFSFKDISGEKATVVMFICNHCPYVIHVNEQIVKLYSDYKEKGIGFVGISSNDAIKYPMDGPEKMKAHAHEVGYQFPYLYDESQAVAKAYDAACTPDFYIFNSKNELAYRGRLDGSRPNSGNPVTGEDLRNALEALLNDEAVEAAQYPSSGCNIKWKN